MQTNKKQDARGYNLFVLQLPNTDLFHLDKF